MRACVCVCMFVCVCLCFFFLVVLLTLAQSIFRYPFSYCIHMYRAHQVHCLAFVRRLF